MRWYRLSFVVALVVCASWLTRVSFSGGEDCPQAKLDATQGKVAGVLASWEQVTAAEKNCCPKERAKKDAAMAQLVQQCPLGSRMGETLSYVKESLAVAAEADKACEKSCAKAASECRMAKAKAKRSELLRDLNQLVSYVTPSDAKDCKSSGKTVTAAKSDCAEKKACAKKDAKVASASDGALCEKSAQKLALAVRNEECNKGGAKLLMAKLPGLTCEKKANGIVASIKGAGCEKSATRVVLASAEDLKAPSAKAADLGAKPECAEKKACAKKDGKLASASDGALCEKSAQKLALAVRNEECNKSGAKLLMAKVPGLTCEKKANGIVASIKGAGCEKSATRVVLASAEDLKPASAKADCSKKDCAKACADACKKAGVACDGKSVGLAARQLMARGDTIKASWVEGTQAYASMCPEKKASLRTALAEQMKVDQKLALMPATIVSLTEGLAAVATIDAKMKAYAEANPEAIKDLPKEAIAAYTRGALVIAKASEVMTQVAETMQKAQSNGPKVAQN